MAIYRLTKDASFGPVEIAAMTKAYEATLAALGLVDRADPITEIIARKVVEMAQTGELDTDRIRDRVLASLAPGS